MKKSAVCTGIFIVAVLLFGGCAGRTAGKTRIGVIQLVEHPSLDASYRGFVDGLAQAGFIDGENIVIDYQNAQGEQVNCVTIADKLVNDNDDLILAIATQAAQAAANCTKTIPILVTAVTDPASANLVKRNDLPGTNVTGTSDLTPCDLQIRLIQSISPDAQTVGMLYCSNEQNSHFVVSLAKAVCDELGLAYIDGTVSNPNEIQQVTQNLCSKVDAIYSPTDNMIAGGMATVTQVAIENKIPVIVGAEGMVASGALATYGINYYDLGKKTAEMAVEILRDGKNPADMPIRYLDQFELKTNEETAAALNIALNGDLLPAAE